MSNEQHDGWSGGRKAVGDLAPGLAHYTDSVLFDEVWERPELSKRDRSLATVSALVTLGSVEQLAFHLPFAREHGVTEQELIETITHLAFYVGWPRAMSAIAAARSAFADDAELA